jgi:hypothetical protein
VKVLVCGSRDWLDERAIYERLRRFAIGTVLLHGDARGADRLAAGVGRLLGFVVRAFPADWDRHGKKAGILRNLAMLDEQPDLVLAFRVNGSRGTTHTIEAARRRGIPVEVYEPMARP